MKPIIFSDSMVRAVLDGRKTQTRRIVKRPKEVPDSYILYPCNSLSRPGVIWFGNISGQMGHSMTCPYGKIGDLLWVRETFAQNVPGCESQGGYAYKADHFNPSGDGPHKIKWVSPFYLPKEASRITLKITGIRVERLQDISKEEALAEGVELVETSYSAITSAPYYKDYLGQFEGYGWPINSYHSFWDSIHGPNSWDKNDCVWVVSFEKVTPSQETTGKGYSTQEKTARASG